MQQAMRHIHIFNLRSWGLIESVSLHASVIFRKGGEIQFGWVMTHEGWIKNAQSIVGPFQAALGCSSCASTKSHKEKAGIFPLTCMGMRASQQCQMPKWCWEETGSSAQLIAVSRAVWMCARPELQSRTQRKQESALRNWGEAPPWLSRSTWSCHPHPGLWPREDYVWRVSALHWKKNYFLTISQKPQAFFFFLQSTARKNQYWRVRKWRSFLNSDSPSVAWGGYKRSSSKRRGFCN